MIGRQPVHFIAPIDTEPARPNHGSHKGNLGTSADSRSCLRPPSAGYLVDAFAPGRWLVNIQLLWTGVEPVTARSLVWCSTSELPIDAIGFEPITERTSMTAELPIGRAAGPSGINHAFLKKTPVGVEPT